MNTRRDIFQAIADPTRRAILTLLAVKAMNPKAIGEHFNISRQAVSKHIQILADCHVVKLGHWNKEIYYIINPKKMKEVDEWINGFRQLWENRTDQSDVVSDNT